MKPLVRAKLKLMVDPLVTYSNCPDLQEQLRQVVAILSENPSQGQMAGLSGDGVVLNPTRRWSLHDRFSPTDLQAMVDLYRSGATTRQVAETFGIGTTSVKRVLCEHGVRRDNRSHSR